MLLDLGLDTVNSKWNPKPAHSNDNDNNNGNKSRVPQTPSMTGSGAYSTDLQVGIVCVTWTSAGAGGLSFITAKVMKTAKINTPPPPIHMLGRMDPQPSSMCTVASEPWWPPLEKATIHPGKPDDQVPQHPLPLLQQSNQWKCQ